jgi:hypothetical protein
LITQCPTFPCAKYQSSESLLCPMVKVRFAGTLWIQFKFRG